MADGVNRPMTGIRGAGFPGTASGSRTGGKFHTFEFLRENAT